MVLRLLLGLATKVFLQLGNTKFGFFDSRVTVAELMSAAGLKLY